MLSRPPLDIVYTWVDDRFPGFQEERRRYATHAQDLNPHRTRDNLDLLKYSLRSVQRYAPWHGRIYIVTSRPQVPRWLNAAHPGVTVVYLDEIMPAALLPCFNAFAIESFVHTIPGLSQRFVHFNDDMLLAGEVRREDLEREDGTLKYYFAGGLPRADRRITPAMPPFQAGRSNTRAALERALGRGSYPQQSHHPRVVDRQDMHELIARFPDEFARTRAARFRGYDTILPHMLLAAYLVRTGRAVYHGPREARRLMRYVALGNAAMLSRAQLWWAMRRRPAFLALNDSFGTEPNARAEAVARRFLEQHFTQPSPFEH